MSYPRYLSNHPKGVDLFEGKSQERLAQAVAAHMLESDEAGKPIFSRLIGLEGKWGSGKSNVIKILEDDCLKEKYTFFCFDAWGNQEDLQRRSILELLTKSLITRGKLTGETTMRVLKPDGDGKVENIPCTWTEKLESLLARKSYTKDITVPSLNDWTKVFVLMLLITGLLIPLVALVAKELCWGAQLAIVLGPILIFLIIAAFTRNLCNMWRMYNTEGRSDTTSFVISEQEPSVREFKDWLNEVSKGLPTGEKLVIVFDNMDRLSSEKVHQFWSLIQTFFADDGYDNIWCIVPYDESHLASVFSDAKEEDKRVELLRHYLDKTFPVVYRVPEPIVGDYKHIFEALFRDTFGATVDDDSLALISQCYRHSHSVPNVREIISFINSNVQLAKQWQAKTSAMSRALFVLKKDEMLRNPQVTTSQPKEDDKKKTVTTEEYLLANEYSKEYSHILMGSTDASKLRDEIAAMAYGVEPEQAAQIVVRRYIRNCLSGAAKNVKLSRYQDNPYFMMLLQEDVQSMDVIDYIRAVAHINELDDSKMNATDKDRLSNIWRYFAIKYNALTAPVKEYGIYEKAIFSHVSEALSKKCITNFCKRLISCNEVDGAQLYEQLSALFNEDYAKTFNPTELCPATVLEATRFANYVKKVGKAYKRFPFSAKSDELNSALKKVVGESAGFSETLTTLKDDTYYKVAEVGDYAVQQLNRKAAKADEAANLIAVQRIFYPKFKSELDSNYINTLWLEAQSDKTTATYAEIYALKASTTKESLPSDEQHVDILMQKSLFYATTSQILKDYLTATNITYRSYLLKKMINECVHDGTSDYVEFIEHWQTLVDILGVDRATLVHFADSWGYKDIPEPAKEKQYFSLLAEASWIDILLAAKTPLADALLKKCVADMSVQPVTNYIQANTSSHANTNWDKALQKLIGTDYATSDTFRLMPDLAAKLLDYAAKNGPISDAAWKALLGKVSFAAISEQVTAIRNHILNGEPSYVMNAVKFQFLHGWLEQADINGESHCSDAANQILAKVIDDEACRTIILAKREYYRPIIANTTETASGLHGKLKNILENQGESEFATFIAGTVAYDD